MRAYLIETQCLYLFQGISITTLSFEKSIIIETSFMKSPVLSGDLDVLQKGVLDELKILSDIASSRQTKCDTV